MVSSGERAVLYSFIAKNRVGYKSEGNEGGWNRQTVSLLMEVFHHIWKDKAVLFCLFLSTAVLALIVPRYWLRLWLHDGARVLYRPRWWLHHGARTILLAPFVAPRWSQ